MEGKDRRLAILLGRLFRLSPERTPGAPESFAPDEKKVDSKFFINPIFKTNKKILTGLKYNDSFFAKVSFPGFLFPLLVFIPIFQQNPEIQPELCSAFSRGKTMKLPPENWDFSDTSRKKAQAISGLRVPKVQVKTHKGHHP